MSDAQIEFRKRGHALRKKHLRMARGYHNRLDRNGVILQEPDGQLGAIALRLLSFVIVLFMGFKVMVLTGLGSSAYALNLAHLDQGTIFERIGAWFMQVDPITAGLSALVAPLFH